MPRNTSENLVQGTVVEALPSTMFRVRIAAAPSSSASSQDETVRGEKEILAHLSGKMRIHYIKVMPGDTVLIKMSPDGNRGIIMRRI